MTCFVTKRISIRPLFTAGWYEVCKKFGKRDYGHLEKGMEKKGFSFKGRLRRFGCGNSARRSG